MIKEVIKGPRVHTSNMKNIRAKIKPVKVIPGDKKGETID